MKLEENKSLKDYLTMRLGGKARYFAEIQTKDDVVEAFQFAAAHQLKTFVIGGGSNTLADDEGFDGLVMHMCLKGRTLLEDNADDIVIRYGAGEILDEVISDSVDMHLTGIEAMSLIPGTIGAAPVQNVGAYGQDISQSFVELEAYDMHTRAFVTLSKEDCQFAYRASIFRGKDWGRYIIVSVTLRLQKGNPQPPFYKQVQARLDEKGITSYTPALIRETVIEIRKWKLPDPHYIPNSGSFFKNAIITKQKLAHLQEKYPTLKGFAMGNDTFKISTGWLIDQAGLKGASMYGMRVHDRNALVLTNVGAKSYHALAKAREDIITEVNKQFGIKIVQEVLEMH